MPDQVTNYQCPSCGGPLHFDAELQKLKCDYCGSTFTNEEITEYFQEKNDQAAAVGFDTIDKSTLQWSDEEASKLRAYNCPSCGAQLICDETTAATACPYCGNPTVVPAQFTGALKPDYIIPFKLNKEQAVKRLSSYYKGKPLLPNAFSNNNHIEEIKGVYVPFWLYDGAAEADMAYNATRSHSHTQGDYLVTVTEHFQINRQGTVSFNMVPADGSSKMPDELMDAIEPFNYNELVGFEMAYLPGYLADRYDLTAEDEASRADHRMKNSAISAIRDTVHGYETVTPQRQFVNIIPERVHYAFLPVWLLSTRWNGQNYLFAMNGQTGKYVGDLPGDKGKMFLYFFLIFAVMAAILGFLLFVVMGR